MIINADNLIVGRIATVAAKAALLGEEIIIVNSEKAILSGKKEKIFAAQKQRRDRGTPSKGPIIPRRPDMFLKRSIRGMLDYKKPRGKEAFERITCYVGVPKNYEGKELTTFDNAHIKKMTNLQYTTVGAVCKYLGGKV